MKTVLKLTDKSGFNSTMLDIGEMMVIVYSNSSFDGHVLLRTSNHIVNLTNPAFTWNTSAEFPGRKFLPGDSITLIQE